MPLLIATTNAGKAKEFAEMFAELSLPISTSAVRSLRDLPPIEEIPETGDTFAANAALKASGYAKASSHWTLADDSGLVVDALVGRPGVFSARWASMHQVGAGDAANNQLLLDQLRDVPVEKRTAHFACALALSNPAGNIVLTAAGAMPGSIGFTAAGDNGFGYDPLFRVAGSDRTSAQLSPREKHAISHRGTALRRLAAVWLRSGVSI